MTLIVPDIALHPGTVVGGLLAQLAGRGTVHAFETEPSSALAAFETWQASLLESCELLSVAEQLASAPLSYAAQYQKFDGHCWAHLECVHFAAGLNDVVGVRLRGEAQLTDVERSQFTALVDQHLSADGCTLLPNREGGWLLKFPRALSARTVAPERAFSASLSQALPSGEHGAELRRLLTELQMVLHEHPLNEARARRGVPTANAVWLWGAGAVEPVTTVPRVLPIAYGSRSYLKGLYLVHGRSVRAEEAVLQPMLDDTQSSGHVLGVVETSSLDVLESQWLAPLVRQIRRGAIRRFTLHLGRWRISLARNDLFRFWRKPRALPEWGV